MSGIELDGLWGELKDESLDVKLGVVYQAVIAQNNDINKIREESSKQVANCDKKFIPRIYLIYALILVFGISIGSGFVAYKYLVPYFVRLVSAATI